MTQACAYHPDREAYVSCQRCNKPICPQCQVVAAVGFQCPACVKAGSAKVRAATTTFGGRPVEQPVVTYVLVGIGALLLLLSHTPAASAASVLVFTPGLAPGQPWRYLTYALPAGGGVLPIVTLWIFYLVGRESENLLGRARFIAVWALVALGGAVTFGVVGHAGQVLYGSTAVVLGVGATWLVLVRKLRGVQVTFLMVALVALALFTTPWPAVLGSVVVGAGCGGILTAIGNDRRQLHWAGLAAVLVLLVLIDVAGVLLTVLR